MEASPKRSKRIIDDETTAALIASTATTTAASKKRSNGYVKAGDNDDHDDISLLRRLLDTDPNQLALTAALRDDDGKLLTAFSTFCNSLRSSIDKAIKFEEETKNDKGYQEFKALVDSKKCFKCKKKDKTISECCGFRMDKKCISGSMHYQFLGRKLCDDCMVWTRTILLLCTARSALNFYVPTTIIAAIPATNALYAKKSLVSAVPKNDMTKILEILIVN